MEIEKRIVKHEHGYYIEIYHKKGDISFYHREDGPAKIQYRKDNSIFYESYWVDDKLHREEGPAFIEYNEAGSIYIEKYWVNGKELTKEEWYEKYGWKLQLKGTPMGEIFGVKNE